MIPIPVSPSYLIDEHGNVFRQGKSVPLRHVISKRGGYLQVSLWERGRGKTFFVHQLVALAFHGPRPSNRHHAAHRDGNKLNNTPTNIEWITREENEADKVMHGRANIGSRNGGAKLTEAQIIEIRSRVSALPRSNGGRRIKKGALAPLAVEYGVTESCLRQAIVGQSWNHIQ